MSRSALVLMVGLIGVTGSLRPEVRGEAGDRESKKGYVICFDFASTEHGYGEAMADTVRLKLRRHTEFFVLDRITSQEGADAMGVDADRTSIAKAMTQLGLNVGIYGTVTKKGKTVTVDTRCLDLTKPDKPVTWSLTLSDDSLRWRAVIGMQIVEKITGVPEWVPPQYGDETEPEGLDKLKADNRNGDFENGHVGWNPPDNVSTFLEKGPPGRGTILRIKTNLKRDPWLEYTRNIRLGLADPTKPPTIAEDSSFGSVAGLEGVHFRSEWIKPVTGQRYWVTADCTKAGGTPKVFVKGFLNRAKLIGADGLPERSLVERKLTAQAFALLPEEKRKAIVDDDVKTHPDRYRQECYRWYLNLREGKKGEWHHFSAPFPPRGGLPANVEWLRIDVYSYWPPGEYLWDNVRMIKDPRQKAPIVEEAARTKNLDKKQQLHDKERKEEESGRKKRPAGEQRS